MRSVENSPVKKKSLKRHKQNHPTVFSQPCPLQVPPLAAWPNSSSFPLHQHQPDIFSIKTSPNRTQLTFFLWGGLTIHFIRSKNFQNMGHLG